MDNLERKLNAIIGRNIKYYRQIRKITNSSLTQEKLSELADVSTSLIGNLESENVNQGIGVYNLWKISNVLDVPISNFFVEPDITKDLDL